MRGNASHRGFTLIEVMAAMGVMLIGAVGLVGLHKVGVTINGDARRMTRATAIAQDLLNQIELWPYTDARLTARTGTSTDIGDTTFAFEKASPPADFAEANLAAGGAVWNGIPAAGVAGYERYWNVVEADDTNGNGLMDAKRIGVVVRWQQGGGWRRVVLLSVKRNPVEAR
jgi:prepilin-type N-terminal cleavage/methylation domain-containing protein